LQKIDQVLIEPDRDVIVVLNPARMPQANLVNEPPEMRDAAEQGFGAAGILLI
jgi:hypothetical protein